MESDNQTDVKSSPFSYRELVELYGDTALPLEYLDLVPLTHGGHNSRGEGVCAMELDAWLAGRPHTDRPPCVSSVLSNFARTWNDNLGGDTEDGIRIRNELIRPLLPRFLGTAGDGQDSARGYLAFDWLVRVFTPAWLGLNVPTGEWAQALRDLAPIGNLAAAQAALPILSRAEDSAGAAWSAARSAATLQASARDLLERMIDPSSIKP